MRTNAVSKALPGLAPTASPALPCEQVYRLYVTAGSPVSSRAVVNARRFFDLHLPGNHILSVLDLAKNVELAKADQIVASPTLVRVAPLPQRRFIGDMSDVSRLRLSLGLAPAE